MAGRSAPKTVKVQDSFQCLQYLGYITLGTIWHPALCIHSNICALWQSAISQSNSSLLTRKCLGIKKSFLFRYPFLRLPSSHHFIQWNLHWRPFNNCVQEEVVSRKSTSRDKGFVCLLVQGQDCSLASRTESVFAEFPWLVMRHKANEVVCAHARLDMVCKTSWCKSTIVTKIVLTYCEKKLFQ